MLCYMLEYGLMSTELMLFPLGYSRQQSMSNKLVQSLAKIYSWLTNPHTFPYIISDHFQVLADKVLITIDCTVYGRNALFGTGV